MVQWFRFHTVDVGSIPDWGTKPESQTAEARLPRARALQWERPPHALQLERACVQQRGLSAALSVF